MQDEKMAAAIQAERQNDQYSFHEFPKILYRDKPKGFEKREIAGWVPPAPWETLIVNSNEDEAAAVEDGWRPTAARPDPKSS